MYYKLSSTSQGIFWAITCCLLVSVMLCIVKHLSENFHTFQIIMMRSFFALILLLPFIVKNIDKALKTTQLKMHFWRGMSGFVGMCIWFYAVTIVPLSETVAISFIVPITTTIAAIIFLKEKVPSKIWISLVIGFIGVLLIIRPGFRELSPSYFITLLIPILWTTSNILTKKMVKIDSPKTITLYLTCILFITSIPLAAPYLKSMSINDLFWFFVLGGVSNLSSITNALSYFKADMSKIQPFDFTRLIFTAIIAYFAFGEKLDLMMAVGSIIILFGSTIIIPKKSKSDRFYHKIFKKKSKILPLN